MYTLLVDVNGSPIPFTTEDGHYEYKWPSPPPSEGATFAVEPPMIINSSILPPQTIQLNVTMKNVTDMYGYGFSLNYDHGILWCVSLTILDVLGETNYLPQFSVDNTKGIITVNVTYIPPAVPITTEQEVPLVALVFRVKGIGATLLDLNNTSLVDSLGRPIPHVANDGLFVNIIRDLAVTNVVTSSNWVYQGNQIKINVTVKNQGNITETSITVNVYYEGNMFGNTTIASINPSEEVKLIFTWDTKSVTPCRNYTISANVTAVPYELNLTNNIFVNGKVKVRYYGDANGDGVVNMIDLQLIKLALPSTPDYPNWNPYADVDDNGVANILDYQQVKRKIGGICPP
jgi:archaellum component FlaF (FlaF/FlaG flagellin family)